jgi:hypothetical protein
MEYMPYTLSSVIKDHLYCKTFIQNDLIIKYTYGLLKSLEYLEVIILPYQSQSKSLTVTSNPPTSYSMIKARPNSVTSDPPRY